jgi:hypothetical protein
MRYAYILYGVKLKILFQLVRKNRFSFNYPYIFRFLFILHNALWASLFSAIEKIIYRKKITAINLPTDPLIIIGNWRTGSTYLHYLLQMDPQMTVPTHFQVTLPDSFLFSGLFYKPMMKLFMGKNFTRPMDNVLINIDSPQEDEFALLKMSGQSPLVKLVFPDPEQFFLLNYRDYELDGKDYEEWKKSMEEFCKKIYYNNSKRIVLKNPFHSLRIKSLLRLFPDAKFIHICRHPFNVIPSTINMWNIVGMQNSMNPCYVWASIKDTVEIFDRLETYIHQHTKNLSSQSFCEIKYEDLIENPAEVIKKTYRKLGLPFTGEYEKKIKQHPTENFKKNIFTLSKEDKKFISEKLKQYMDYYGYS